MLQAFYWIVKDELAGSGQPGYNNPLSDDFTALKAQNIQTIVTLTEQPLAEPEAGLPFGIELIHFPIPDMKAPNGAIAVEKLCRRVQAKIELGQAVLYHCREGTGRTGTLLACQRVYQGCNGEDAIAELRKIEPLYVRNSLQENFVLSFDKYMGIKRSAFS